MARLPFVDPDAAPEPVREALDAMPQPLGLFRMVAHASTAFRPWLRYGLVLLSELELDPLLRELVILQVAHTEGAEYEWVQHTGIAKAVGATDEQIAAIEAGELESPELDERQSAVLRVARAVVAEGAAPEDEVKALAELLGPRQMVELLLVIGQYMGVARLVATLGLEPDPPLGAGDLRGDGSDGANQ
ncbi:MAG: carboxymuconolactone decarboxylase family protein [Solirubrobacterales bacterium]